MHALVIAWFAALVRVNGASGIAGKGVSSERENPNRDMKNKRRIYSADFKILLSKVDFQQQFLNTQPVMCGYMF